MLAYDRIKLLIPLEHIHVKENSPLWKITSVNHVQLDGTLHSITTKRRFGSDEGKKKGSKASPTQYLPGINYIEVDYSSKTVIVTITSKVLGKPSELITSGTIREVFTKLNQSNLISLDALAAYPAARLLAADITVDHIMQHSPAEYTRVIRSYYTGHKYLETRDYRPNIQLQCNVRTPTRQRTLTLYNKHLESKDPAIHPHTLRWELRLNSFHMLRKYLGLPGGDIMLSAALETQANPVQAVFNEIRQDIKLSTDMTINDTASSYRAREDAFKAAELTFDEWMIFALLKEVGFNLEPLEEALRGNPNKARKIKPFREVLTRWNAYNSSSSADTELLREMIEKVQTVGIRLQLDDILTKCLSAA